jgi:hypothetical protein
MMDYGVIMIGTRPGLGASHQTGWTALLVRCFEDLAREHSTKAGGLSL